MRVGPRSISLLFFSLFLFGCVEPFSADLDRPSPAPLVVDGSITTGSGPHSVVLSEAAAFEQSQEGISRRIEGAKVVVADHDADTRVTLEETEVGRYETEKGELPGVPGHVYHLEVTLSDGRKYESVPKQMPEPVPLDSIFATYEASPNGRIKVSATADDPEDTSNRYRWSVRNIREYPINSLEPPFYCWEPVPTSQITVLDDRLIDGGRIEQAVYSVPPGPGASRLNQVNVRQLTLTKEAYDFWSKVAEQVEDADDPFSSPPRPIRGNIEPVQDSIDRALGYFEVVGASEVSTTCFRQSDFEEAPPGSRPSGACTPASVPSRDALFERPSDWICSTNQN